MKTLKTKGFTLIELLVVIVIIGILVAIALPNFIKIKDKAKEAEVKQQLHAIQLAVERYATDEDGNYPYYLYGGESKFNLGTACEVATPPSQSSWWRGQGFIGSPFDMFNISHDGWDYQDVTWNDLERNEDLFAGFGDSLAFEGYLPKYPKNPFLIGDARIIYAHEWIGSSLNYFGAWGGYDGSHTINFGWWGEMPELMFLVVATEEEALQNMHPGQFYYHPRFSDGITNQGHCVYQAQYNDGIYPPSGGNDDSADVNSLDVAAYDLSAWGSPRTKGMDIDTTIPRPYSGIDVQAWRTGYFTLGQERNPYVGPNGNEGDFAGFGTPADDFDERPFSDSIPDFFIIHLTSGLDTKRDDLGNV
jgi:type II secretion system protein G